MKILLHKKIIDTVLTENKNNYKYNKSVFYKKSSVYKNLSRKKMRGKVILLNPLNYIIRPYYSGIYMVNMYVNTNY